MVRGCNLSDAELAVFGVKRIERDSQYNRYIVPCAVCGKPVKSKKFGTNIVIRCDSCITKEAKVKYDFKKLVKKNSEKVTAKESGIDYEHYHRFESAVESFGVEYYYAIQQASKVVKKFDSIPEVIACIELLHIGARVIPHQKVGSFTVDFCLPDEKVVIEIDGLLYHKDADKEYRRDYALKNMLGDNWVIKHIPAEAVKKDHELFGQSMKRYLDDRRFELNI